MKYKQIKLSDIKLSPIRQGDLEPSLLERLRQVWAIVGPYDPSAAFEQFEMNFRRDAHPEREIRIFEGFAAQILEFERDHPDASESNIKNEYVRLIVESVGG